MDVSAVASSVSVCFLSPLFSGLDWTFTSRFTAERVLYQLCEHSWIRMEDTSSCGGLFGPNSLVEPFHLSTLQQPPPPFFVMASSCFVFSFFFFINSSSDGSFWLSDDPLLHSFPKHSNMQTVRPKSDTYASFNLFVYICMRLLGWPGGLYTMNPCLLLKTCFNGIQLCSFFEQDWWKQKLNTEKRLLLAASDKNRVQSFPYFFLQLHIFTFLCKRSDLKKKKRSQSFCLKTISTSWWCFIFLQHLTFQEL